MVLLDPQPPVTTDRYVMSVSVNGPQIPHFWVVFVVLGLSAIGPTVRIRCEPRAIGQSLFGAKNSIADET
jgi:hypothetical protein